MRSVILLMMRLQFVFCLGCFFSFPLLFKLKQFLRWFALRFLVLNFGFWVLLGEFFTPALTLAALGSQKQFTFIFFLFISNAN